MKTVRRLLYRDIVASVLFIALAFLSLFFFIDFVDELGGVGVRGRTAWHAVWAAILQVPGHLYELAPIAVLIGTIYSLARLAQSSEFTILRTGGLGPGRALGLLAVLGLVFGVLTFVIGDYVAPASQREEVRLKARFSGTAQHRASAVPRSTSQEPMLAAP
jgi:lipopolysaccharide export system permease protein